MAIDRPYEKASWVYRNRGWLGVLPMPRGEDSKRYPPEGFTGYDGAMPDDDDVSLWRMTRGHQNIAIRLPHGVIGVDIDAYDNKQGATTYAKLVDELGPWTLSGGSLVRSSSRSDGISGIYLFRAELPEGAKWRATLGRHIDVVHFGHRYVMAAPSRHPSSGNPYRWLTGENTPTRLPSVDDLPLLADPWIAAAIKPDYHDSPRGRSVPSFVEGESGTKYGVSSLKRELEALHAEWDAGEGGFNDRLNRAAFSAGQLVAGGELDETAAKSALNDALAVLAAPADQYKTLDSGFAAGLRQPRHAPVQPIPPATAPAPPVPAATAPAAPPVEEAYRDKLVGTGQTIDLESRYRDKKSGEYLTARTEFANFDMRVLGRIIDDDGVLTAYNVELTRSLDGKSFDTLISPRVLARVNELTEWLNRYEAAITFRPGPGHSPTTATLSKYLVQQQAPIARTASCLGWDDESGTFLTFDGAIDAQGLRPFDGVRPDPLLRGKAVKYRYGFEHDEAAAVSVLREVLTFHDPTVCSVFGAWWAACLLKGQIMRKVSMFPAMGIEAPSESGKTNGFFPMMIALGGNLRGQSNDTAASFRDQVAGHRNGIAWQDDLDDPRRIFELIRAATSEGVIGKKGEDKTTSVDSRLVAPIMVTGEGLDMSRQKAMVDRVVLLTAPSPKGRKSLHDPSREQWDDIVQLRENYPDMSSLAGHLVVAALRNAHLVDELATLRGGASGRHSDKIAVMRVGARVLAAITGDTHHVRVVDAWASRQVDVGNENALTLHLVPEYLRLVGAKDKPRRWDRPPFHSVPFPVLIRADKNGDAAVWVNTDMLAQWWKEHRKGNVEVRTETAEALRQQAADLGMKGRKSGELGIDYIWPRVYEGDAEAANRNEKRGYQRLPNDISDRLFEEFVVHDPNDPESQISVADTRASGKITTSQREHLMRQSAKLRGPRR